jgi:hypothetical protein
MLKGVIGTKPLTRSGKSSSLQMKRIKVNIAIVGQGPQSAGALKVLSEKKFSKKTVVIASDLSWIHRFPSNHIMGQSAKMLNQLSLIDTSQLSPMPNFVQTSQRDVSEANMRSVFNWEGDELSCVASQLLKADRYGEGWSLSCADGTIVDCNMVVYCGGPGPDRTLQDSGVIVKNKPSIRRTIQKEIATALESLEIRDYFKGKKVLIYGGGATACWIAELAILGGCSVLRWGSLNGFAGADPTGVNGEIMKLTKDSRYETKLDEVTYLGNLEQIPDYPGLEIVETLKSSKKTNKDQFDLIVCATGQNPYAETGVFSVFSKTMINKLKPIIMPEGGVIGYAEPGLIIGGPSLSTMPDFSSAIENFTFPILAQQNRIKVGYAVSVMAGQAAGKKAFEISDSSQRKTKKSSNKQT